MGINNGWVLIISLTSHLTSRFVNAWLYVRLLIFQELNRGGDMLVFIIILCVVCIDWVWIGLSDINQHSSWVWNHSNTEPLTTMWGHGEPNLESEHCVATRVSSRRWFDIICSVSMRYVCEGLCLSLV